jgi:hypothetical protein
MVERWSSSQRKRLTAHWHTTCSLPCQPTSSALTVRLCWATIGCHSVDGSELEVAVHRRRALGYENFSAREFSVTQIASVVNRGRGLCPHASLLKNGFKPGSSLSRAKAGNCTTDCSSPDNLFLFLCCFSNPTYLTTDVYYITHTLVGCRASPPQGWEVYSTIWLSIV